jgi:hypothetical protein
MKQTHQNALISLLGSVNGASFITIDTCTEPAMTKTLGGRGKDAIPNPHYGRVKKVMTDANVMVFQNKKTNGYEAMIQRRLTAEGKDPSSFELGPRKWGTRLPDLPIVEHNGNYYLEVIFLKPGKSQYYLDDQPVNPEQIQGLRPVSDSEQGGLDNKVTIRTFGFDSITQIKIDGTVFKLV